MTFLQPQYLWALAAAPLALLLGCWALARGRSMLRRFSIGVRPRSGRAWLVLAMEAGAFALIALALAGPERGRADEDREPDAVDIMVALDVSLSMRAADAEPSRGDRARREAGALLERLATNAPDSAHRRRAGLVEFAGAARMVSPLTGDLDAVAAALEGQALRVPLPEGSDLAAGLQAAIDALEPPGFAASGHALSYLPPRVVVMVTDGEHRADAGRWREAASVSADRGVRIAALVIGTPEGARIGVPVGGFLEDRDGNEVLTRAGAALLAEAAEATGGVCLEAREHTFPMDSLYNRLMAGLAQSGGPAAEDADTALHQWFALGALLLLLAARGLPRGIAVRGLPHGAVATVKPALLPAVIALLCAAVPGCGDPGREAARRGNDLFRTGDYAAAAEAYRSSLEADPGDPGILLNRGLALYRTGAFDQALAHMARAEAEAATDEKGGDGIVAGDRMGDAILFGKGLCLYRIAERAFIDEVLSAAELSAAELSAAADRAEVAAVLFERCRKDEFLPELAGPNAESARSLSGLLEKRLARSIAAADKEGGAEDGGAPSAGDPTGGEVAAGEDRPGTAWSAATREDPGPLTPEERRRIFARLAELKKARAERAVRARAESMTGGVDW